MGVRTTLPLHANIVLMENFSAIPVLIIFRERVVKLTAVPLSTSRTRVVYVSLRCVPDHLPP